MVWPLAFKWIFNPGGAGIFSGQLTETAVALKATR